MSRRTSCPAAPGAPVPPAGAGRWGERWFWWGATAAGLVLRLALLPWSPALTYPEDHDDFVRWGILAADDGVLTVYERAPPRHDLRVRDRRDGQWSTRQRGFDRVCNYPPGAVYLLWLSGGAHRALSADRLVNTVLSHALYSVWSIAGDLLVAWGCAALVARFKPGTAARMAYVFVLLLPPLWYDSVIWAQMDSVVLAPAVWMLYFMAARRWLLAGALWGVALGLKTQGILLVPLWGLALFVGRPRWGPWLGGVVAVGALGVITAPFTLTGEWSEQGPDWFRLSYWNNVFAAYTHLTTLKAFNVWYLDLLISDSLDAKATLGGMTKQAWGHVLLLGGLLGGFGYCLWWWRRDARVLVFWAALSLLALVMLPTQVHERYLVLALPFLGVASALAKRLLPALAVLVVVMMAQITWPHWLPAGRGSWPQVEAHVRAYHARQAAAATLAGRASLPTVEQLLAEQRAGYAERRALTAKYEWTYTLLALGASLWVWIAFLTLVPQHGELGPTSTRAS